MTGFPWSQGDALLADDLNAAIAGMTIPAGGSIQAAIDALPATGGEVRLSPNTTYVLTAAINSTKPNVRLSAPGWGTVIQRGPALSGTVLELQGAGCRVEGMTFDGNGLVNTSGNAEVQISGANSRISNVQAINCSGSIHIAVTGAGGRVDHCTIIGRGVSGRGGYGVWALGHVPVTIDHNTISGTSIDGIGADGAGTIIDGNRISGCHCDTTGGGGQLVVYPNTASGAGVTVSNNFVGQGGASTSGGLELNGNNLTVTGNTIVNQYGGAIGFGTGKGLTITGNTIVNVGLDGSGAADGIGIQAGVTDFVITGNRVSDDQTTTTMRYAVAVANGASDRYTIVGNQFARTTHSNDIADGGTGTIRTIRDNGGLDSALPLIVNDSATLTVSASPVFHMQTTGTLTTVTRIGAQNAGPGVVRTVLPNAAYVFQAGNNIHNTFTAAAQVPFTMVSDISGNWWLR